MGRKPKYPDADKIIRDFFIAVSESYNSPSSTESVEGHKKQDILAEEFDISRLKVRKILITTGDLVYSETAEIQQLMAEGLSLPAIGKMLGMQRSTLNAYLPYNRGVYKLAAVSAAADRTALILRPIVGMNGHLMHTLKEAVSIKVCRSSVGNIE